MSGQKIVFVVQQWITEYDVLRMQVSELRNLPYYDFEADVEREDPLEFAIDNPDQSVGMVMDEDPEEGEYLDSVRVFSTRERAKEWVRLMYMYPNRQELREAPMIWRYRVGFCD